MDTRSILVVDDDDGFRDSLKDILEDHGYEVFCAGSCSEAMKTAREFMPMVVLLDIKLPDGESALDLYEKNKEKVSLVLLDLIMPGMGGKRCLEELLRKEPSLKIAITSGYTGDEPETHLLEAGAKGFIRKPYNTNDVLKVIRQVLDQ
jgi:DNA-binding response OmpR family regulator